MEPEGSLPHSQAPATCPYPEPAQSSPHTHIPLPEDHMVCNITENSVLLHSYFRNKLFSKLMSLVVDYLNNDLIVDERITLKWISKSM
jgi:hypothetical protein